MKQSLQLKMGQHLTMTPQLQQAIRLLQLSTLDLQQEIQAIIDTNPMLEASEDGDQQTTSDNESTSDSPLEDFNDAEPFTSAGEDRVQNAETDNNATAGIDGIDNVGSADSADGAGSADSMDSAEEWGEKIPDDLPVDSKWDDVYQPSGTGTSSAAPDFDDSDHDSRNTASESLASHLLWQLNLTPMSDKDALIATAIIDALEPSGMLGTGSEELLEVFDPELDIELDEIEAVRHRIQQFDPVGVASTSLCECLMVQLGQMPATTAWREQAAHIIHRHLNLLASRDFTQLMRRTRLKEPELRETIALIRSLDPHPGDRFNDNTAQYVVPDVYVRKIKQRWVVELNPDIAPRLRINANYASLVKRADNSADNTFLRDNLQEARWFLKSLHSRNETLLKVASKIVEHQRGFLEHGAEAMKPLVLHDIANDVDMHESTISRVTTQKYMHTPRGIFELKYFFSSHVATAAGGECSSTAIRAIIKKLVAAENARKPLSDSKIANILDEQGIKVARRTIAKYRESMAIPPSNERKRLI